MKTAIYTWTAGLLALGVMSCAANGGSTSVAAQSDTSPGGADLAGDATKDAIANPLAPDPLDRQALQLLLQAKAAAAKTSAEIWPQYGLAQVPTYLVRLDAKDDAVRGWLVDFPTAPKGAFPIVDPLLAGKALRYDAELDGVYGDEWIYDLPIAATSAYVITYSTQSLQDPVAWTTALGEGYMERLRRVEAQWFPVGACGQTQFPREQAKIALLFLDRAVLREAYQAQDPAVVTQRLREWYAIHRQEIEGSPLLTKRLHHYDNQYATSVYTSQRLVVATGLRTQAQLDKRFLDELAAPATVPVSAFDDAVLNDGWSGATTLTLAARLGWQVEPYYRDAGSVYEALPGHLGEPPDSLVDDAKKRHDWAGFQDRAQQIVGP